jgi:hypothetical protein
MTDTKQAVKELREALAARAKDAEEFLGTGGMCEPPDDEPLLTASIRHLPAVLDRLEELELEYVDLAGVANEEAERSVRLLDAERARFLEFRAAMAWYAEQYYDHPKSCLSVILARFPVEPEAGR